MTEKTILITGATGGIGKATAIALAKLGHTIIIHGRNMNKLKQLQEEIKASTGNSKIDLLVADMFLLSEVRNMADEFKQKYNRLDVLINNAGGIMSKTRETTSEGFEKTLAMNLFAPFLLTGLLLSSLKQSPEARVINVSSNSHKLNAKPDFDDLQLEKNYNPLTAYGNAKLFLIWISQHLTIELKKQGIENITVNTMHPGAVASNFGVNSNLGSVLNFVAKLARPLFKTVEQGADTIIYLASSNDVKNISGRYFVNRKQEKVSNKYYTATNEKVVWDYCEKVTHSYKQNVTLPISGN